MTDRNLMIVKIVSTALVGIALIIAGIEFYNHRNFQEPVVIGPGVTNVKTLGDYFAPLKGTINDTNIYIIDSGVPGGTALVIGRSHPEEPATNLAAQIFVENAIPSKGRLIVAITANQSASRVTRPGDAYPMYYTIETPWGESKYRMGDRWTSPLDSWPDPETYVHYPSGQLLAYMDIRNFNRTWPGRENGMITEQTNYAFMNLIREEGVDVFIDLHEAELEYPVISTIVAHQKAADIAGLASMILTSSEFRIGMEFSPPSLHGLSHREVGDHSDAISLLFETPEPFLDRVRGITDEALLLTGKDEFVMTAGKYGLLYEKIDEKGWPIDVRVGRHCSTTLMVLELWSDFNPGKEVLVGGVPRYDEVVSNGTGFYFQDPSKASASKIYYE
ncbi:MULTISPECIES: succinylglutamate desuccinylase [unclassified Mesotoga]|jgi:hypothetical protein|uniref:succinylglutamate desuccinylase n=1 Tax=unclassified Mesotoga TaxID=1184398 RepID=UPI000E7F8FE2|nr:MULTISPECIES: succinylglutamate desuccinylase [unclassified Mesotoga]HAY98944.1 succinylglutamate desuccinylase [Mesotoga sp.]